MLGNEFNVQDVSDWNVSADELSGHEEKTWLCHPGTGEHWLYKPVTMKDGHTPGGCVFLGGFFISVKIFH